MRLGGVSGGRETQGWRDWSHTVIGQRVAAFGCPQPRRGIAGNGDLARGGTVLGC
jgi:hypothetical protein